MTWTKKTLLTCFSRSRQTFSGINLQTHLIDRRMRKNFHFYVLHHRKSTTSWWLCQRKKAPGCDGITTDLLRLCAPGIAESLAILFNRPFLDGAFPSAWKLALVTPVFKKGNAAHPNNYRPISLLSAVGKVCEKLFTKKLHRFAAPLLSNHQPSFCKKDGAALQLTRLVQEWSEAHDNSEYVGVVFFTLKRHLIRSGTREYWLNSKQSESRVALFSGSEIIFLMATSV